MVHDEEEAKKVCGNKKVHHQDEAIRSVVGVVVRASTRVYVYRNSQHDRNSPNSGLAPPTLLFVTR